MHNRCDVSSSQVLCLHKARAIRFRNKPTVKNIINYSYKNFTYPRDLKNNKQSNICLKYYVLKQQGIICSLIRKRRLSQFLEQALQLFWIILFLATRHASSIGFKQNFLIASVTSVIQNPSFETLIFVSLLFITHF